MSKITKGLTLLALLVLLVIFSSGCAKANSYAYRATASNGTD